MLYTFTDDIGGDSNGNRYFASASNRKEWENRWYLHQGNLLILNPEMKKSASGEALLKPTGVGGDKTLENQG
jgi:hypothetical protein